jgi:hypothetical protein
MATFRTQFWPVLKGQSGVVFKHRSVEALSRYHFILASLKWYPGQSGCGLVIGSYPAVGCESGRRCVFAPAKYASTGVEGAECPFSES